MQNFGTLLIFIAVYDKKKINKISSMVNFSNLKEIYKNDKKLEHYNANIIRVLYNLKSNVYIDYLEYTIDTVSYINTLLFALHPDYALQSLKNGKNFKMHFHGVDGYDSILEILFALEEENEDDLVLKILNDNKDVIKESMFNNTSNVDQDKSKYDFLVYIYNKVPGILDEIYKDEEKISSLIQKLYTLFRGKKMEKQIGNLYLYFIKEFSTIPQQEIEKIHITFPSTRKFVL